MSLTILQTVCAANGETIITIAGNRTPSGVTLVAVTGSRQTLLAEMPGFVGTKRAFIEAQKDAGIRALAAKAIKEAQDRYAWQKKVADAEALLDDPHADEILDAENNHGQDDPYGDEALLKAADDLGIDLVGIDPIDEHGECIDNGVDCGTLCPYHLDTSCLA